MVSHLSHNTRCVRLGSKSVQLRPELQIYRSHAAPLTSARLYRLAQLFALTMCTAEYTQGDNDVISLYHTYAIASCFLP